MTLSLSQPEMDALEALAKAIDSLTRDLEAARGAIRLLAAYVVALENQGGAECVARTVNDDYTHEERVALVEALNRADADVRANDITAKAIAAGEEAAREGRVYDLNQIAYDVATVND